MILFFSLSSLTPCPLFPLRWLLIGCRQSPPTPIMGPAAVRLTEASSVLSGPHQPAAAAC